MRYILVRHPKPFIENNICYGQTDLEIDTDDIQSIIDNLSTLNLTQHNVYTSPLKRCHKVASAYEKDCLVDKRLMEINFNKWEMKNWDSIAREEIELWSQSLRNYRPGDGESYNDLLKRVNSFIKDNQSEYPYLIFTHAGVIRAFMELLQGIPIEESLKKKIEYGSYYLI